MDKAEDKAEDVAEDKVLAAGVTVEVKAKETVEVTDEMDIGISQIDSKKNPIPNQGSANFPTLNAITVLKPVISRKIVR